MKKVLHIISHFELGGAEIVAMNIAKSKEGLESYVVEVVAGKSAYSDAFVEEMDRIGVGCFRSNCSKNKLAILQFPFTLRKLLLKLQPDVVHAHTEVPDLGLFLCYKMFPKLFTHLVIVRTIHNTRLWSEWERVGKRVEAFYKQKGHNVAISQAVQQSYMHKYGEEPPIIYNGVDVVAQQRFPDLQDKKVNVLFAGRLEKQKGVDQLIAVIKSLPQDALFEFYIVGTGSLQNMVEQQLKNKENVHFYPVIYGLSRYLSSFDYLFMPSNHEGLALLAIEASMVATPPIINACPGLEETLPQSWPLKVHNNDVKEYVRVFLSLSEMERGAMGREAMEYARKHFSLKQMQRSYEKFYSRAKA